MNGWNGEQLEEPTNASVRNDSRVSAHDPMMHHALAFGKCLLHHRARYASLMESANDRLRHARERAGYSSAKGAAEAMGAKVPTYIQHENGLRGSGNVPREAAERYAKFFRVPAEWIMFGTGEASDPLPSEAEIEQMLSDIQAGLPASLPYSEWPRAVAAGLRMRLALLLDDRSKSDKPGRQA